MSDVNELYTECPCSSLCTRRTDRRTDGQKQRLLPLPYGRGHNKTYRTYRPDIYGLPHFVRAFYLPSGGYAIGTVCLALCLSVCLSLSRITAKVISRFH